MNNITNLRDLYFEQLRDLYSAETQLVAALPEMIRNATDTELSTALSDHLEETTNHVDRLEQIFAEHGASPDGEECEAMRGLIKEAQKHVAETPPGEVRDAAIIASGNRIEHYEIAGYGVAKNFAQTLGFDEAADTLDDTLEEEGKADKLLTRIATGGLFSSGLNREAVR